MDIDLKEIIKRIEEIEKDLDKYWGSKNTYSHIGNVMIDIHNIIYELNEELNETE